MADTALENAVDLAREVAVEAAGEASAVGEHLRSDEVDERLLSHVFACSLPGYRGWVWNVVLSRIPRGEPTVCEAHLVPADDALLAPPWVPWAERVRPGDLEPTMVLPFIPEDPRLIPGYEETSDADADALAIWELGLGRARVLGPEGRDELVDRWYRGSHGPSAPSATVATAPCSTCGFFLAVGGSLRPLFGVCANEWSPSDGKVVSVDHGCGAHSETDAEKQAPRWPSTDPVIETDAAVQLDLTVVDDPAEELEAAEVVEAAEVFETALESEPSAE